MCRAVTEYSKFSFVSINLIRVEVLFLVCSNDNKPIKNPGNITAKQPTIQDGKDYSF